MNKINKFSPEVRERAVRLVQEHRDEYPSLWAAVESIAPKIGCLPQTLLEWVKREEVDSGQREGLSTSERDLCNGRELLIELKATLEYYFVANGLRVERVEQAGLFVGNEGFEHGELFGFVGVGIRREVGTGEGALLQR